MMMASQVRKRSTKDNHRHHLVVSHNYHDHANESPPENEDGNAEQQEFEATRRSTGGNASFPIRLYDMLETADGEIVTWQPRKFCHGKCPMIILFWSTQT